jgi:ADP-ribosylglycohydrolase
VGVRDNARAERLAHDSLIGLSVGDALGARFEGSALDPLRLSGELVPGEGLARWTDDTQMALCVYEALAADGHIDCDGLAHRFALRYEPWRGYGRGMHSLLPALRDGGDWRVLAERLFPGGSYGNGSAMRVAPLGAYFHDAPVERVAQEAERSAAVTHAHPEARAGAVAVAVAAWLAARSRGHDLPGRDALWDAIGAVLDRTLHVTRGVHAAASLPPDTPLGDAVFRLGNGSHVTCADTVPLALWIAASHLHDFPLAIRHAVAAGGDADTIAAIAGGIVAARVGAERIPQKWRAGVEPLPIDLK